jgi:hypothetical protein
MGVCDFWKTLSLDRIMLLYECKISSNIIMKRNEIWILKSFGIVYVYVKSIVKEWCDILVKYKQ